MYVEVKGNYDISVTDFKKAFEKTNVYQQWHMCRKIVGSLSWGISSLGNSVSSLKQIYNVMYKDYV